jgi:hypothetical protein
MPGKSLPFMEAGGSLPYSKQPDTGPYPEPHASSPHFTTAVPPNSVYCFLPSMPTEHSKTLYLKSDVQTFFAVLFQTV